MGRAHEKRHPGAARLAAAFRPDAARDRRLGRHEAAGRRQPEAAARSRLPGNVGAARPRRPDRLALVAGSVRAVPAVLRPQRRLLVRADPYAARRPSKHRRLAQRDHRLGFRSRRGARGRPSQHDPADALRHPARLDRRARLAAGRPALSGADPGRKIRGIHDRQMDPRHGLRILPAFGPARKNRPAFHGHARTAGAGRVQRMGAAGLSAAALFIAAVFSAGPAGAEKIRTAVPQGTLNYLSVYAPDRKGFFHDEGLDNETIIISGPPATAALLSGDVDYSGPGGSGMRAAAKGAPLKVVMFQTEKVTWYMIADASIKKAADLKGRKVAVGTIGDTQDRLTTLFVERAGLAPGDITRIMMGTSTTARILAIKTGAVQAATVDPGGAIAAELEGLKTIAYLGDLFPFPFQGFATLDKKIADNPAQIKRWLRAMIRGLIFLRERPEESAQIAVKKLQLGNVSAALLVDGVKRYARALPEGVPGMPSPEGIKNMLEYDVQLPMNIKEPVAPEQVLNLKFVEEAKKEFEAKRANR